MNLIWIFIVIGFGLLSFDKIILVQTSTSKSKRISLFSSYCFALKARKDDEEEEEEEDGKKKTET